MFKVVFICVKTLRYMSTLEPKMSKINLIETIVTRDLCKLKLKEFY